MMLPSWLRTINKTLLFFFFILVLVLLYAFALTISDNLASVWIPVDTKGLQVLSENYQLEGSVDRRLIHDSLWLPLKQKKAVYLGDTLWVRGGSHMTLVVPPDTKVELEENTLVRLQFFQNKLLIVLKKGEVHVKAKKEVMMQVGESKTQEPIKEGRVGVVPKEQQMGMPSPNGEAEDASTKNPDQPGLHIDSEEDLKPEELGLKKFPYPVSKTVFLHFVRGQILVLPLKQCEKSCRLKIRQGSEVKVERKFNKGMTPFARVDLNLTSNGQWSWVLEDSKDFEGQFEIQPMTSENFQRALKDQKNIEILEQVQK